MRSCVTLSLLFMATLGSARQALAAPPAPEASPLADVLFTRPDGLAGAGRIVFDWLSHARWHGLELAPDPLIARYIATRSSANPADASEQADVERALHLGLARLVAELPPAPRTEPVLEDAHEHFYVSPDIVWRAAAPRTAAPERLTEARKAALDGSLDRWLWSLAPQHPQYRRLVAASEHYATLCAEGGWPTVPLPKNEKRAEVPEVAAAFQARLLREGYYVPASGTPSGVWDDATRAALTAFRETHQIAEKGVADPNLVDALNVSCADRLATLALNARRWRISAWNREPTRVEVNLAGQELRYYRASELVMFARTVVGSTNWYFDTDLKRRLYMHASPILTNRISQIIIDPVWAVPPRIARNEMDEKISKDPTWLEQHHFRVVPVNGGSKYVQESGPWNSLGQIKILFPNSEDVYLHDTPKRGAFKLAVRALSHGCVRVQNAVDLGLALLGADAETAGRPIDLAAIRASVGHGGSKIYDLTTPVPVFLEYYTASVDEAGVTHFHPDIYSYDAETFGKPPGR